MTQQWRAHAPLRSATRCARFDLVLAVSDADRQTFERLYPDALKTRRRTSCRPASTRATSRRSRSSRTRAHLVFTGSMDWLPNEDGMLYFVRDILPRIRQVEPEATLSIIGRAPTPAVKRLADDAGIEVTGRVDDVRPHIAAGSVYIVPLRIGGGTRLKIFEAMGDGQGGRLDDGRRRRAAGHVGARHRDRRRAGTRSRRRSCT